MDTTMITSQIESWIQTEFAGQQTISKDELVAKAQQSSLPQEAKDGLAQLPQGQWTKDELIGAVRDMVGSKLGAMAGSIGSKFGL